MKCARKDISLPRLSRSRSFQKEFELDTSLPEFLPNISRPVKVDARIIVESVNSSEGMVEVKGKIIYGFLYVSDHRDSLKFTEFIEDFSSQTELPEASSNSVVIPIFNCSGVSCKMLNSRKFILRSKFDLAFTVNNNASQSIVDEKSENCFFKTDTVTTLVAEPAIEREFCFSDLYDLGETAPEINEIITKSVLITPAEHSSGDGYINVKANAVLKALCLGAEDENSVFTITKNIPISFIIEDETIGSDSICVVDITPVSLTTDVGIDSYGNSKVISTKFCVKASVHCSNPEILTFATDVFAADTTNTQKHIDLQFSRFISAEKKVFAIEKIIETGDIEFNQLYDSTAVLTMNPGDVTGKETVCNGNALVSLLGNTPSGPDLVDISVGFTERLPATDVSEIIVRPIEVSATAVGGSNVSLKIIAAAEFKRIENISVTAIENCEFTDMPVSENIPSILLYYPSQNDDLWTISKRYGIAPDRLKAGNNDRFDGEKPVSGVVLIPQRQA